MARKQPFIFDAAGVLWWVTRFKRRRVIGLCYWTGRKLRPLPPKLRKLVPAPLPQPLRPLKTDYWVRVAPPPGAQWLGKYDPLRAR